jgi:hypothetical protein
MNPYTEWAMASLAVLLPTLAVAIVTGRICYRRGWDARGLEDQLGPQDDDAPLLPPEPVAIAAITAPGEMFRESGYAPRHAPIAPRREIAFGGAFPDPGPVYRPYTRPMKWGEIPGETDTAEFKRITDEFLVRHGLNP